ncbi:hypothetical protein K501DRAFT_328855 [Backusella circina FSU 941]|nr:hypothetical protein K501DRAFT_328855 [Backusella circina FSU 941]
MGKSYFWYFYMLGLFRYSSFIWCSYQMGGNEKARHFFEAQPDYDPHWTIQEKYHSPYAEAYRERLSSEVEGAVWKPTNARSINTRSMSSLNSSRSGSVSSFSNLPQRSYSCNSFTSEDSFGGSDSYFAKLGSVNEHRPEDLPPSQGGKFTGFGNPQFVDEPNEMETVGIRDIIHDPINKGLSLLVYVGKAASSYVSSFTEPSSRDPTGFYTLSNSAASTPNSRFAGLGAFPFPTDEPNRFPVQEDDYFEKAMNQLNNEEYQKQHHQEENKVEKKKPKALTVRARSGSKKHTEEERGTW